MTTMPVKLLGNQSIVIASNAYIYHIIILNLSSCLPNYTFANKMK